MSEHVPPSRPPRPSRDPAATASESRGENALLAPKKVVGGEHVVPTELGGRPLDGIVRTLFGVTWGDARKWIRSGKVQVDSQVVVDHERGVRAGVKVVLTMHAPKRGPGAGRGRDAPDLDDSAIVFVDAHVIVVNKPAGVSSIPFDENEKGTLDERVRGWLSKRMKKGDRGDRPSLGVVHRLDKETSGVLVFTRTWLAKQSLSQQFRAHTVHRRYLSIAHGAVRARTIRSNILADRGDGLRGSLRPNARGKREEGQLAITHIEPVEALTGATLVACKLETGRTHQIRVHLSEAGHPVVGERVYIRGYLGEVIPAPRLMLHAAELGFVHPATNVEVRFERPPPSDFEETLGRLRK
jgi:23S rRNA pseudouridine1911/1915/1917 synthase